MKPIRGSQPLTFLVYTRRAPPTRLSAELIRRGQSVLERSFSAAMNDLVQDLAPDLIVALLDLSDPTDLGALDQMRGAAPDSSILVLAPDAPDRTLLHALEDGADFILAAGTSPEVIAVQAEALLRHRRRQEAEEEPSSVSIRELTIDFARRRVVVRGRPLDLTRTEFDILGVLVRNQGRVVSPLEIIAAIGQQVNSESQARIIVKVHISHLRQKLEAEGAGNYLETVRGVGYLLERDDPNIRNPQPNRSEYRLETG